MSESGEVSENEGFSEEVEDPRQQKINQAVENQKQREDSRP